MATLLKGDGHYGHPLKLYYKGQIIMTYRCKTTGLSEHHARKSTFFLSRDVESTERMALGCDVHNAME
jgi:hypothetical protein